MSEQNVAKAGRFLQIDCGTYDDPPMGVFVVLRDFDPIAELDGYLNEHPEQRGPYRFDEDVYMRWLQGKGLVKQIQPDLLYLGASSDRCSFTLAENSDEQGQE